VKTAKGKVMYDGAKNSMKRKGKWPCSMCKKRSW